MSGPLERLGSTWVSFCVNFSFFTFPMLQCLVSSVGYLLCTSSSLRRKTTQLCLQRSPGNWTGLAICSISTTGEHVVKIPSLLIWVETDQLLISGMTSGTSLEAQASSSSSCSSSLSMKTSDIGQGTWLLSFERGFSDGILLVLIIEIHVQYTQYLLFLFLLF